MKTIKTNFKISNYWIVAILLSPGFLLFDTLFTTNVIEQFLWLLATYFLFRMISRNNSKLWILIGILLGLAFLNKYSVLFVPERFNRVSVRNTSGLRTDR